MQQLDQSDLLGELVSTVEQINQASQVRGVFLPKSLSYSRRAVANESVHRDQKPISNLRGNLYVGYQLQQVASNTI